MKKWTVIVLCFAFVLTLAACGKENTAPTKPAIGGNVEIANPFTEYDTLADAAAAAGFEISVPDSIDGYSGRVIRVLAAEDDRMIEVIYQDGENKEVRVRKAPGAEDISGDYNQYDRSEAAVVGDYNVTLQGNGDTICLATWTAGEYTYSVSFSDGVSTDSAAQLIAAVG